VASLIDALGASASPPARVAILRALEAIHDPRAVGPAARLVDDPEVEVATSAVAVLRAFIRASDLALSNAAFERLTGVVLDESRKEPVRAAALEALSDLPPATTAEVLRQLRHDRSAMLRGVASRPAAKDARPRTLAEAAAQSRCPEPGDLRAMIAAEGRSVPLPTLARVLDLAHAREAAETATARRTEWQAVRGAIHQALAARGSRLALYDLRESLSAVPGPLPVGFVAALERVGDATCLDPITAAYVRAARVRDPWWMEHLQTAFRAIVARERLTRRAAAVRHVFAKWPGAAADLWPSRR
jgi:HEAT repeat protein